MSMDVVIINHGTPQLYRECAASVQTHFPPGTPYRRCYKIIGVDNSPPEEAIALEGAEMSMLIENRGFGNACNVGASKGSAPFLLFLNADTRATPQINLEHVQTLFDNPAVGIVGPRQVSPQGWIASAGCPFANNGVGYEIRGFHEPFSGQYGEALLDVAYVPGSVFFIRREVFEKVGGFLEDPNGGFSQYYEDATACYVARKLGYRTLYTGWSTWIHVWDAAPKPKHDITRYHEGGHSGIQWATDSHKLFVARLKEAGYADSEIPPRV